MADEYIKREDALQAQNKSMNLAECRKRLERVPAADVRPVVTCEKCRYYHVPTGKCLNINGLAERVHLSDYCSYGSEREVDDAADRG